MKLAGDLKDKVEKAENKEEAKKMIEDAGMILDNNSARKPHPTSVG